jgi:hypothetical protein
LRSQARVEFTLLLTFLFLMFVMMFVVLGQRLIHINEDRRDQQVNEILDTIVDEVKLAQGVENGYKRPFFLPKEVMGKPYLLDVENHDTLIVTLDGKPYVRYLPTYVMGGFCNYTGGTTFNLSISKEFDMVSLSSCYNCTYSYAQCANAQTMGLCDTMDTFFPGFKKICQNGHCKCLA